ncbi:AzlC family ABC transporter permease [Streptomyces spiralis]|uniref:AzlC family ABC transporter permease n=1 Tax=Streptomyces spiralis TaxID=66376 RepID=UPI0036A3C5D8
MDARSKRTQGPRASSRLLRDALGIGVAVGAYGLSYGALAVSSGLTVGQTQFLSLALYGGSSQLALVGALAAGGGGATASATAVLLGVRNLFYGISLRSVIGLRGRNLVPAAHLLSDESAAMALGTAGPVAARYAYWATGVTVFACWNLATLTGALAGSLLADPKVLGLDAASSAAFVALVAPRLRDRAHQVVLLLACLVAVGLSPLLSAGLPVVAAGLASLTVLLMRRPPTSRPAVAAERPAAAEGSTDHGGSGQTRGTEGAS